MLPWKRAPSLIRSRLWDPVAQTGRACCLGRLLALNLRRAEAQAL